MLRCAIWAAVSSEEQAKSDKDSIPDQQRATRAKVAALGGEVVADLRVEESRELLDFTTACTTIDAYSQLRRLVDSKAINLLVFLNRGRLGRTAAVIESLALYCLRGGVALYDLSSPPVTLVASEQLHSSGDQLNGVIQSWRYQNEMTELRRRHKMGMARRAKEGKLPGAVPFGWVKVYDRAGDYTIQIDEQAAAAVRLMFRLYVSGEHMRDIVRRLNGEGFQSPGIHRKNSNDRKPQAFSDSSAKTILLRAWLYAGYLEFNKKSKTGREFIRVKSSQFPAIIDEATAQEALKERAKRGSNQVAQHTYLFSGVVTCSKCDRRMACVSKFGAVKRKSGKVYSRSVCKCMACRRILPWLQIERVLMAWFESLPQQLPELPENDSTALQAELERVESAITAITKARARALDAYVRELTDETAYQSVKNGLDREEKTLQDRLHLLRLQVATEARKQPTSERYQHVREVGKAMLEMGKAEQKRVNSWLREYIRIEFDADRKIAVNFA